MKRTHTVTFYSYKGGVGRTTAMLNTAYALARAGRSVFVIELDLEAPSLMALPLFAETRPRVKGGVVDILASPQYQDLQGQLTSLVVDHHDANLAAPIRILTAGWPGPEYATSFGKVDFAKLFSTAEGAELFELLRREIESTYAPDFLLIDSRTGLTDVGAVAVFQLADTVVLVTTLSEQSLAGSQMAQLQIFEAADSRREPLKILRLASHVPADQPELVKGALAAAEKLGLTPHYQVRLQPHLFVKFEVFTRDYPDDPFTAGPLKKLALDLIEQLPAPKEKESKENTFALKVAAVFRLMGCPVEEADDGLLLMNDKRGRRPLSYLVLCGEHPKETEIELFARRLAVERKTRPELLGLVVSRSEIVSGASGLEFDTFSALQDELVDFGSYNAQLTAAVRGTEIETRYVEPLTIPEGATKALELRDYVHAFLSGEGANLLVLLGDFGTGKTWFSKRLAAGLAEEFDASPKTARRPIRIDLREVAKELSLEAIFRYAFPTASAAALLHLIAEGRIVLIFDGFDEMATAANFEVTMANFRQLMRTATGRAKVILTCRTHYFRDQAEERRTALYEEASKTAGFRLTYLPVMNEEQVREFIYKALGKDAEKALRLLEENENLKQISTRPVLLDMVVRTVDQLQDLAGGINQSALYKQYTDDWLARNDWRLKVTKEIKDALMEELALLLWERDTAQIHYSELQTAIAPMLKGRVESYDEFELAGSEVRSATFLIRDDAGNYRFAHRSFLEYFLARRLARRLDAETLAVRRLSPPVIAFVLEILGQQAVEDAAAVVLGKPYTPKASENALLLWKEARG